MLRTLLTPLVAKFDLSPRSPTLQPAFVQDDDDLAPEDFARDVLIELMRNSVENLKQADTRNARMEVLVETRKIMQQEERTKDVFRELDGFLVLISVLSTAQTVDTGPVVEPEEQVLADTIKCTELVLLVASEAMYAHSENTEYFTTSVGFDSLANALQPLISDQRTTNQTLGFLLCFALHDFSFSDIFVNLYQTQPEQVDITLNEFRARLGTVVRPGAIYLLWNFVPKSCASFRLFEVIATVNHRNLAIMSTEEIVRPLLEILRNIQDKQEKSIAQKLQRKLLEMGASTADARTLLQSAIKDDGTLDMEVLELIRAAMKSRWLEHFSLESPAALVLTQEGMKGMPVTGFTFMIWLWVETLPEVNTSHRIFAARVDNSIGKELVSLNLNSDGKLELLTSSNVSPAVFNNANIARARWMHITLVHYPGRDKHSSPSIRLFIDGVLNDSLDWYYPKSDLPSSQAGEYVIGDDSKEAKMSWCFASAYLLSLPLADDIPRFIHHLGPRYFGNFQDTTLVKFLTYDASTSLNMFLSTIASASSSNVLSSLVKAVRDGMGIPENAITFSVAPLNCSAGYVNCVRLNGNCNKGGKGVQKQFETKGDVYVVKAKCLDMALWTIGGAAIPLRLIQVANTPHEISRALGVLTDGLKNSWQNSEDMENLRGYEVLADILRTKAQKVNLTSFETLFEFLGINFRSPEASTIVNMIAYKSIALDFELWSHTRQDIQRAHLEHFITLLVSSRYRRFNIKQRFAKLGLVRRLLFVLQADWYQSESTTLVIEVLKASAQALWTKEDAIKPLVSFLAANLQEDSVASSPHSIISRIEYKDGREKAEQVLQVFVSILCTPTCYTKFAAALPVTRICLLLLGDKPSPTTASQILVLVGLSISTSSSFIRKFELISGWNVLKSVLPTCWDARVSEAAFDILLGRIQSNGQRNTSSASAEGNVVTCPQIAPAILSALRTGLSAVANNCEVMEESESPAHFSWQTESTMETLVEQLMNLHASSGTFRQVFQSQQTTQLFVNAYKSFVGKVSSAPEINLRTVRILEKLTHFGLALALDNAVAGAQKREILDILQSAETVLNPSAEKTTIDPNLVADTRSVRQRIASARFSTQVGERTVVKTITRMVEWRQTIQVSERKRLRKNILDLRENRRQISRLYEWNHMLTAERGLWANHVQQSWRLDETEGPHRIRKKMEPENSKINGARIEEQQHIRDVQVPEIDNTSALVQVEVPPWADTYEISSTEIEDRQLAEEITEDKHRRVRHELEPGDVIEAVSTVARVAGVDSSPGLLIIGRTHIYMLDGLVESEDGEVIDAHDAPKRLFFVPGSIVELEGPQRAQRWAHDQITTSSNKTFLFRDVALEIYFKDSRSLLVVFLDKRKRLEMDQHLSGIVTRTAESAQTPGLLRTPLLGKVSARVLLGLRADELLTAQRRWQAREISNFTYLSVLNQISGRTPSDATQYPVFPWVLQDYSSQILDLSNPDTYRDLTKPMGALTAARREAAETRYSNLESVGENPFHYGTHFSSSMITLQGGDWDLPDRLFSDIARAYESAARDVRGDVRELIPEFFNCPEFLENSANIDFGVQQNTGERIHDVKLPPWARQDPLLFIIMNRRALESPYVSENLPTWIDLIWGCKQRDPASLNAFHPLSYEGSIDLDAITDELEREATVGIIHNFGQTPRKLFNTPHPQRYNHGLHTLPIGTLHGIEEDALLLSQGSRCFRDLGSNTPVRELVLDMIGERIIPCPEGLLCVPLHPHEQIEWGPAGTGAEELRVLVDGKVVQVIEGAFTTCAAFADSSNLVTGGSDHTVRLWTLSRGGSSSSLSVSTSSHSNSNSSLNASPSHIMRMHTDTVLRVAACRAWSIVVSGSRDGSAAIWDLNRGVYVRSIWHSDPNGTSVGEDQDLTAVHLVEINESTGYIATCSRLKLCLHTINARPLATLELTMPTTPLPPATPHSLYTSTHHSVHPLPPPPITAIAFHEREYSHLGVLATGGPDGTITLWTWNADGTPEGEKARWEFVEIRKMKVRAPTGSRRGSGVTGGLDSGKIPGVTVLKFLGESLCHGEDSGKSYVWSLPD